MCGSGACSAETAALAQETSIPADFVTLARVLKTQGRHGEIAVELHTSHPDRFAPGMTLFALGQDGKRREVELEGLWPHKGGLVLKLKGIDSINDAETFFRCEIQVPASERAPLEPGEAYISDLVGCDVLDNGIKIGQVKAVQFGAGDAPLLVVRDGDREHLVPLAEEFLESDTGDLDVANKQIRMRLPEGLLEMNLPLKLEKKQD